MACKRNQFDLNQEIVKRLVSKSIALSHDQGGSTTWRERRLRMTHRRPREMIHVRGAVESSSERKKHDLQDLKQRKEGMFQLLANNCSQNSRRRKLMMKYRELLESKSHLQRPTRDAVCEDGRL